MHISFSVEPKVNLNISDTIIYINNSLLSKDDYTLRLTDDIYTINFKYPIQNNTKLLFYIKIINTTSNLVYLIYSPSVYKIDETFAFLDLTPPLEVPNGVYNINIASINNYTLNTMNEKIEFYTNLNEDISSYTIAKSDNDYYYLQLNLFEMNNDSFKSGNFEIEVTGVGD